MKKQAMLCLLAIAILSACAPPSTPDLKATERVMAHSILATLTAQVPSPTYTPTLIPTPTITPKPSATFTPTSLPTWTPLPTPVLPKGWQVYESLDGNFTVAYPDTWGIQEEEVSAVVWDIPGPWSGQVRFAEGGAEVFGEDDEENSRMHNRLVAETWSDTIGYTGFKILDKGVWTGSIYKGYFCEFIIYKEQFLEGDIPNCFRDVMLLTGDDIILIVYGHFSSKTFDMDDHAVFETMINSIRLK